jgi:hypothetical protein
MTEQGSTEKRQHPRIPARLPVRIGTEGQMYDGTVQDISAGGLRVRTSGSFPLGSMVSLYVQFPSATTHVRARVVREGQGGSSVGLAFSQGGAALMRAYERWEKEVVPEESEAAAETGSTARKEAPAVPAQPVKRRLETSRGNNYEILIVPDGGTWQLTVHYNPRNPHRPTSAFEGRFNDYASAEQALREFLKAH